MKNQKLYVFVNYIFCLSYASFGMISSIYWLLDAMIEHPDVKYPKQCKLAAEQRKRTVSTIHRNVNQLNNGLWEKDRLLYFEMAGSCLKKQPSDKEFLKILLDEYEKTDGISAVRFGYTTLIEPKKKFKYSHNY